MKNSFQNDRIIILGGSSGLGAQVASRIQCDKLLMVSRKSSGHDFSRELEQDQILQLAHEFDPSRIFYFAGGGPYGSFAAKNWRDHLWAFQVNFLFAARLIHSFAKEPKQLKQLVVTGSAIAESAPDQNAASYSTAKHALKALFENLQDERLGFDLRLFSPGYMDTRLLPQGAHVRSTQNILDPAQVATQFCDWVLDSEAPRHKILK